METTNGLTLLVSAEQDEIWPSHAMANEITESLEQVKFSYPYQHIALPGGHDSFTRETQNQVNQFLTSVCSQALQLAFAQVHIS
ncbi:acyl-CoA thioester hydrolase/BAAT C-terminal domain-containing protein [Pseudoalteromonas ardens]|uniref:acyl-CoA thioester hydrolase/BAAT C-terminal domain-containing protein n=1 Tax=Pseudoalteromonas ardens TaxID=3048490 RepID=UPI0024C40D74|nr:acyl-CoA thioester hydrolase/BAAT C-terminal domain-containing protein [Pseudoalteromonas sp. R96]MDK1309762.1 acyl-CoA thioester hydrolase/BAAT C-terminal domain-containing protein [Pseudoalteromonas sp. R96]